MNDTIKQVKNILEFNSIEFIGSWNDTSIKYKSDIDLQEFVVFRKSKNIVNKVSKILRNKILKVSRLKNVYFTDFKMGHLSYGNIPIHWTLDDIKNNKIHTEDNTYTFEQAITMSSVIKCDFIITQNNELVELSINYYFSFGNHKTFIDKTKKDISISLMRDYHTLLKEDNKYKAMKRLYKYNQLNNKDNTKVLEYLNSDIGKDYIRKSKLESIQLLKQTGLVSKSLIKRLLKNYE